MDRDRHKELCKPRGIVLMTLSKPDREDLTPSTEDKPRILSKDFLALRKK